jgi:glutamate dehydrogenase/leucine dehydrogenase
MANAGHERVLVVQEPTVGLRAVIAVHDTTFGPAVGGTRMRLYPSFEDAVDDALLLSRAMTAKAVYAGMPCGGGKAVIFGDPLTQKTPALLEAYGRAIEELDGRFFTGCDMGIEIADLAHLSRVTCHVGHTASDAPFDASDLTAIGVVAAMRATAKRLGKPLERCTVALQGVGEVGSRLAEKLAGEGVDLIVTDALHARSEAAALATGARAVGVDEILNSACDIFSPNAAGGVITEELAGTLACRAVVGAANNPLASRRTGEILAERGILYAPDFVANAGGLLSVLFERGELDAEGIVRRVERIGDDLEALYDRAARDGLAPFEVADRIVAERLAAERARRAGITATAASPRGR